MQLTLHTDQIKEYLTIGLFIGVVVLSALMAVFLENDLNDIIIITVTAGLIIMLLVILEEIKPVHLLYALCFGLSFLPYINLQMFPLSGVYVIALLFIIISLISIIRLGRRIEISPQAKWMVALLGIGVLSAIVAPDKKAAIIYGGQFFLYICIYVLTVNALDSKVKIVRAFKYIIYGSLVTVIISFVQLILSLWSIDKVVDVFFEGFIGKFFIGSRGLERVGESAAVILNRGSSIAESSNLVLFRVFGTFEGPTIFGWYLLLIGLFVGGLYIVQLNRKRIGLDAFSNAILLLLITFFLVFTWTRSALLVFLIVFIFILIYRNKKSIIIFTPQVIKGIALLIAVPLAVVGIFVLFQIPFPFEMIPYINVQQLGGSVVLRLLTMLFALSYLIQNPFLGIGMGNYKYVQPSATIGEGGASFATAHNTYLELGVELGLPGLIIFLLLLRSFIKQAACMTKAPINSFYHTLGIVFYAVWLGFILISLFGGNLVHPRFMTLLWVLAGIQTASYHLYLNEKKKENTVYRLETAD